MAAKSAKNATSQASNTPAHRALIPRGNYKVLLGFEKAEIVYDITFRFAHKFLSKSDRTIDQMIQAARSGKKNILEGSKAGFTSRETELKLTNVARASLEELLDDYKDFLRVRNFTLWDKESREAKFVRSLGCKKPQTYELYREFVETRPAEIVANIAICLIHQANYRIDRQLQWLEKDFIEHGGIRERLTSARLAQRARDSAKSPNL
jgi:four helix bundle suffix protein